MVDRTRRRALALSFVFLFVHSAAWTAPVLSNVKIGQQDWFGPGGGLVAENSLWGYLRFDYVPDPSQTFFLNVSAHLSGPTSAWVIQNIPLFPSLTGSSLGLDFDLGDFGISSGTDVTSLDVILSLDSTFQFAQPVGAASILTVDDLVYFSWHDTGGPGATDPFTDPGRPNGNKNAAEPDTTPKERDIKALQEEALKCFPGSMARSLDWLNREYAIGVNKPIDDIYKELRDKVNNPAGADVIAQATAQIRLKDEYANATFNNKIVTKVYDPSNFVNAIPGVSETAPADEALLSWLEREIRTEDVELAFYWTKADGGATDGAHIVTLVSTYKTKDGKTKVRYRDDETQGDASKGDKEVKEVELYVKDGAFRFGADSNRVWYMASESVPEPTAIALMGVGAVFLAARRRLTTRRAVRRPTRGADLREEFRPGR